MEKIKKKILVIGSSGMMGHILVDFLSKKKSNFEVFNLAKNLKINDDTIICDILDINLLERLINNILPDIIINTAGILVKDSKSNPLTAILVNACFPHNLLKIADKINSKIIHMSTDCVFDGSIGLYNEDSAKTPTDIYGKTKDLGEILGKNHLTIRTSIIGPELKQNGTGLFLWLLKNRDQEIDGYTKSIWSGLTTLELSKAILYCIEADLKGLIHIASDPISKYNLIDIINNEFKLNIEINKVEGLVSDKSLVTVRNDFLYKVKPHQEMVNDLKTYIELSNFKY
jgi:dTDP-4-dehydrorhamnose reductase